MATLTNVVAPSVQRRKVWLTPTTRVPCSNSPKTQNSLKFAAPNFLKMGIKMPRVVVFWATSTMKDEKSAAKFHYIKTVSSKVVERSIAFRPLPPEILPPGDLPSPVNGILWEMSELITQERLAVGCSNFVEGLTT